MALATQVPLTALMVVYTFIGLSITAEPIVESRAAAEPTAAASETVAIPADAVLPEAGSGRLQPVGPDKRARLKLTYKVLGSAFHDGTKTERRRSPLCLRLRLSLGCARQRRRRRTTIPASMPPPRPCAGISWACASPASMPRSKSFRVGDVAFVREVFTVEVYLAIAPEEPDWSALVAPPWSTLPWHVLALMEQAVERGWAAFSQAEAHAPRRRLARSRPLRRARAASSPRWPPSSSATAIGRKPCARYVTAEEARKRWAALAAFHKAHGHFLVTNGPYKLKSWSADSVTLEAFRDLTYPLGVGSYDAYAIPRRGFVTDMRWEGGRARALRRHRDRRQVPAQLPAGAHAAEVGSRRGLATRGAGVPVCCDGRERPGRAI